MPNPLIHLAQMAPVPGKPKANIETIRAIVRQHAEPGCIIVFPEMAIGGYLLGDLWLNTDWCRYLMEFNQDMAEMSREAQCTLIYGNVYLDEYRPNKDGRLRKFNAAYIYENGMPVENSCPLPTGVVAKTLLPNYRFFDDERYFLSALGVALDYNVPLAALIAPFRLADGTRVGIQLCEDLWCADYRMNGREINTGAILAKKGADVILNLSASPWTYGKAGARDRRIQHICSTFERKIPYAYVNRTGVENCGDNIITYDGGSTVYNTAGQRSLAANAQGDQEVISFRLTDTLAPAPAEAAEPVAPQKFRAIVAGLRHVGTMCDFTKEKTPLFIIGVSGGVDSCVALCLLEQAFGPANVIGVTMPGRFTSDKTLTNAHRVTAALGVRLLTAPIEGAVKATHEAVNEATGGDGVAFHLENEQARMRGNFLSGIAARMGAFYTNNGNKLETALGYDTLYGDINGAVAPLADVTKVEIIELAKYLNAEIYRREVIPTNLFPDEDWQYDVNGVAPSAELAKAQIDPMKFGYHDALLNAVINYQHTAPETILGWFIENTLAEKLGIQPSLLKRWGLQDAKTFVEDLEWFFGLLHRNVFKRIQAPPIIITSKTAFGYDLREALFTPEPTTNYLRLKAQILNPTSL